MFMCTGHVVKRPQSFFRTMSAVSVDDLTRGWRCNASLVPTLPARSRNAGACGGREGAERNCPQNENMDLRTVNEHFEDGGLPPCSSFHCVLARRSLMLF